MRTRVILHVGLPKTGSTALQTALFHNRELLATVGVNYPEAPNDDWRATRGRGTSGNGVTILDLVTGRGQPDRSAVEATMRRIENEASGESHTVLYSSEAMFAFDQSSIRTLAAALAEIGADLCAVVYVRDIAGHAVSAYAENVKRRLFRGSLSDYIADPPEFMGYTGRFHERLQSLSDILSRERICLRHFDSDRPNLVQRFFRDVLGISECDTLLRIPSQVSNRSLTPREVAMMRFANRRLHSREAAQHVAEAFVSHPPLDPGPFRITSDDLERLQDDFGPAVAWVNENFFEGVETLTVSGGASIASDPPTEVHLSASERFLVDAMVDVVESDAMARERELVPKLRERLITAEAEVRRLREERRGLAL